jgi:hypothetical protein
MSSNPYKPLNPAQLIESAKDEPIGYLVDGLLPIGSLNMLAGKPKSGKSTLVRQLAACVAKGDDFLGRSTTKGDVLYFASEEIGAHLAEHFGLLGISKAEDGVHTVLRRPGINFVSRLVETLKIMPDVRLVIVDPLVNFLPGVDMDNYGMIAPALADMVEGAAKNGVSILVVHHTKKRDTAETGDSVLGSSAIIGAMCTSLFLFGEMGNTRTIKSSQRYGTRLEHTELEFDTTSCSFSLGSTAKAVQQRRTTQTREDRVSSILLHTSLNPAGIAQEDLRLLVGCSTKDLGEQLTALQREGRVTRCGEGKKGSPFLYSVPNQVTIESESPAAII